MSSKVSRKYLNILWPCRKPELSRPNIYVSVKEDGMIGIGVYLNPESPTGFSFYIDRRLARLLAKRINKCLDDTGRER